MELAVAEAITRTAHTDAQAQARADLDRLLQRAAEAGRERSRKIIKITTINHANGTIRHNPVGRLLRDWYLHVYLNTLRANLNQPNEPIDVEQVEETAAHVRRVRADADPSDVLKAVGVVRRTATADAADATVRITERLHRTGAGRAIQYAPDDRFEHDQLRVHITRHWYQRSYNATVDGAVIARHPLAAISDAEIAEVARALATREVRQLIGRDGIPLVTAHGTTMTDLDRRLAAGESGLTPAARLEIPRGDAFATLGQRVSQAWNSMPTETRTDWLRVADAPSKPVDSLWGNLDDVQQMKLVRHYLATHRLELLTTEFSGPALRGEGADVARKMFNHPQLLAATRHDDRLVGESDGRDRAAIDVERSRPVGVHRSR